MKLPVARWLRFNAIGIAGALVQLTALQVMVSLGIHYLAATALAVEAAILHNYSGNLLRFHLANGVVSMLVNLALTRLLVGFYALPAIAGNLAAIVSASLLNYALCHRWVFPHAPKRVSAQSKRLKSASSERCESV